MCYNYNAKIYDAIEEYLFCRNMLFYADDRKGCFYFDAAAGTAFCKKVRCKLDVAENRYTVYCMMPFVPDSAVPEEMAAMYELVCRANRGMPSGRFEICPDSGEICCRYCAECFGAVPDEDRIECSIRIPVGAVLCYMEAFLAVLRDVPPKEACMEADRRFREKEPRMLLREIILEQARLSEPERVPVMSQSL